MAINVIVPLKSGGLRFKDSSHYGRVSDNSGNEVGSVGGVIGGGYEISIDGDTFYFGPMDFWNAVCRAIGREDLIFEQADETNDGSDNGK